MARLCYSRPPMDPAKRVHFAELARHPGLFLRDIEQEDLTIIATDSPRGPVDSVSLHVAARPLGNGYEVVARIALLEQKRRGDKT